MKLYSRFFTTLVLVAVISTLTACSDRKNISPLPTVSPEARTALKKPINCMRADSDLKVLEEEKASVGKQILSGVRMVFPIAAVAGILTGDYSDRVQVATGQYNADIQTKIDQIKAACHK